MTVSTSNALFTFLGMCETEDACQCCGRTGLRRTAALRGEDGGVVYYGTTCAAKALRWAETGRKVSASTLETNARKIAARERAAAADAKDAAQEAASAPFIARIRAAFPGLHLPPVVSGFVPADVRDNAAALAIWQEGQAAVLSA